MAVSVTIDGVDRAASVLKRTFNVSRTLGARGLARFTAFARRGNAWAPQVGDPLRIVDDSGTVVFGGRIDEIEEEYLVNGTQERLNFEIVGITHEEVTDRILYAGSATSTAMGSVVNSIVAEKLAAESINTDNVATGPTLTKVNFPWIPVSQCFDELAELANYGWWMVPSSVVGTACLYFQPRTAHPSPFEIDTAVSSPNCIRIRPGRHRETYRNVQLVRGGTDLTDPRVEEWKGDGETRVFVTEFPVGTVPSSVAVNSVAKTIGIGQVTSGTAFYWNKGTNEIRQDSGQTVLGTSDVLLVRYEGQYPVLVSAQNDGEITARIAAEGGGSGRYESLDDAPHIDDADQASEKARALLLRHGTIPERVRIWTHRGGIEVGQLLQVHAPEHDLSGQYLVQSVTVSWRNKNQLTYELEVLSGEGVGGWVHFWRRLIEKQQQFVIRENEVVLLLRTARDEVTCADAFLQIETNPERRVGYALAGFSEAA